MIELPENVKNFLSDLEKKGIPDDFSYIKACDLLEPLAHYYDVGFFTGVSKAVIVFDNFDKVIKIPFHGYVEQYYDSDEEEYEDVFCPFEGADSDYDCRDYCDAECEIWLKANEAGLGKYFCKEERLMDIDGYPIYIQEKAVTYSDAIYYAGLDHFHTEKERTKTEKKCEKNSFSAYKVNPDWLTDFINCYGEEEFKKFMGFLYDEMIGDFHTENIGYVGNRPVLIDFSDYFQ